MQALQLVQRAIGVNNTSYLLIFIGNTLWVLGLMYCSEDKKMDFAVMCRWRAIATVIVSGTLCRMYGFSWSFATKDIYMLNIRNILSSIQAIVIALSLHYLTSPITHTISNSGPIVVFVMDYFRNGKTITKRELYGIIVTTVGLLATVNASLLMYWMGFKENMESNYDYIDADVFVKTMVALALFLSMVGWAYAIVITKELTQTSVFQINLNMGIIAAICGGLLSFVQIPSVLNATTVYNPMTWKEELHAFFFVGLFMVGSSVFYIGGIKTTTKTGAATIISFSGTVTGYIISIFRYGETPNLFGILGSIILFIGLVLVLLK